MRDVRVPICWNNPNGRGRNMLACGGKKCKWLFSGMNMIIEFKKSMKSMKNWKWITSRAHLWEFLVRNILKRLPTHPSPPPPSQKGMGLYYMDPGNTWSLHRFRLFSYKANIWDCSHCLVTIVRTTWWCIFDGPIKKRLWWILKSTKMNHPTLLIWKSRVQGWSIRIMIFK